MLGTDHCIEQPGYADADGASNPRSVKTSLQVVAITAKAAQKKVTVRGKRTNGVLDLHRFAMVGVKDRLVIGDGIERRISVLGESDQLIPVFPTFCLHGKHFLAGEEVETKIIEPSSDNDFHDYAALEAFHYRGIDLSDTAEANLGAPRKGTGGRRAVLLLQVRISNRWVCAGYIELQMPLMMAKPRHRAFNRPFNHPKLAVSWNSWLKGGQALVNRIARIARVVVNPEMRGANFSSILVAAAITFTRERWHIGGRRAIFLEISAEMLRHIDFVSRCGFHYLGDTEGNRERLAKDLVSINRGAKGSSGIMSLQRRYHTYFETYRDKTGDTFEALRSRIAELLRHEDPWKHMELEEWLALRPVIRSPIPYFMLGLDEASDKYVREAALERKPRSRSNVVERTDEIRVESLELHSNYDLPLNEYSRLIMDSFGITAKTIRTRLVGPIKFTASAGTITFISGSSGCGKSLLLAALDPSWSSSTVRVKGEVAPPIYSVGWLQRPPPDANLFEYLAKKYGADRAFDVLARVGLSEALLFLKPFEMLSRGQRYRAMLADMLLGNADVWLLDEFCSDLDPFTAKIVAHKLRETVRAEGRIAFVAAANNSHFIDSLRPHRVLSLSTGGGCAALTWKEYSDGVL